MKRRRAPRAPLAGADRARELLALLRAMTAVWRFNPDPSAAPDPRAERLAAWGIGVLVLGGAIGTYLVVVGGVSPLLADEPAGGRPITNVTTTTDGPSGPAGTTAQAPAAVSATPTPTPSPTPRASRRPTTTPATTPAVVMAPSTDPPVTTEPATTTPAPPSPPSPAPTTTDPD